MNEAANEVAGLPAPVNPSKKRASGKRQKKEKAATTEEVFQVTQGEKYDAPSRALTYSEKLRDPRWQRLRLQVFDRDGWKCLACDRSDATLHVHHLAYFVEPWDAPINALETLCKDCHRIRENFNKLTIPMFRTSTSKRMIALELAIRRYFDSGLSDPVSPLWVAAMDSKIRQSESGAGTF